MKWKRQGPPKVTALSKLQANIKVLLLDFLKVFEKSQPPVRFKYWDSGINVNENLLIDLGHMTKTTLINVYL